MRIELRNDKVIIDGYVNAVARDSRPIRDRATGERFVEQIVPGVFKRALEYNEVLLLLNHDENRNLGSTATNLTLYEDEIGLRAHAEVEDAEVIEKARRKKLRGWSFGFKERGASEETMPSGMKRRFVEDMELVEVSIIDERKMPCYRGTSIEARAEGNEVITSDVMATRADYVEEKKEPKPVDYSRYKNRIKELEERK
ncbi:HK97 family phage prohead protease [Lachnospiraceae bacterium 54-11]